MAVRSMSPGLTRFLAIARSKSRVAAPHPGLRRDALGVGSLLAGRIRCRAGGAVGGSHHGEHGRTTELRGVCVARSDDGSSETVLETLGVKGHLQANQCPAGS